MGPTIMERRRQNCIGLQCHGTHDNGAQENDLQWIAMVWMSLGCFHVATGFTLVSHKILMLVY